MIVNIVFFIIMLGVWVFYYKSFCKPLVALNNDLKAIIDFMNENSTFSYDELSEKLSEDKYLKNLWNLYKKTLTTSYNKNTGRHELYSSVEVADYFNLSNLCHENGMNISFWQNLGSVFTGVGILGTFAGLVMGIGELDLDQSAEMIKGIQNLLGGLNTAFYTSLGGIACALLFTCFHKYIVEKVEESLQKFDEGVENIFPRKSVEQVLMDALREQQEQTAQLKKFNTDVAMAISDAIDQKLSESNFAVNIKNMDATSCQIKQFLHEELGNVIEASIQRKMEPIFNDISQAIDKLSKSGLEGVSKSIQAGVGDEMKAFSDSLKSMSDSLSIALVEMKDTSKSVNENIATALGESIRNIQESIAEMNTNSAKVQEGIMGSSKDAVKEIIDSMETLKESLNAAVEEQVSSTKDSNEDFRQIVNQVQSLLLEQGASLNKINNCVNIAMEKASDAAKSFKEASVPVSIATNNLVEQQKLTIEANRKYQSEISNNVSLLRDATENTQDNLKVLNNEIATTMRALSEANKEYKLKYEEVNTKLIEMTKTLEEHYSNSSTVILEKYVEGLKNLDDKYSKSISMLSGAIEDLNDALEDFNDRK